MTEAVPEASPPTAPTGARAADTRPAPPRGRQGHGGTFFCITLAAALYCTAYMTFAVA